MKRALCLLLILVWLVFAGCAGVFSAGYDTRDLKLVDGYLDDADTMLTKVNSIIEWQVSTTNADIQAMQNGTVSEIEYTQDNAQEIRAMADELGGYISRFEKMKKDVDAIAPAGVAVVDKTIAAAQHYFSKTTAALADLNRIFDFYFAFEAALAPLSEFDDTAYTDVASLVADMYYAAQDVMTNLNAIDCPAFMEQTFAHFVKYFGLYTTVLESCYTIAYLQYYGVDDTLRAQSINALVERLDLQVTEYTILLSEDINLQYQKVSDRLKSRLSVLHSELKTNIGKLIAYAGQGGV